MQRVLSFFMIICLGLTLSLDANAKRMGGGKSSGSAPIHQTRQAAPQQQAQPGAAAPGRPAAAPSGASRWLGPLAGIAAGGLLASMFMGDGFEGLQILDFLIVALIAFVLFKLFMRRRQNAQHPQPAAAGHAPMYREAPTQPTGFGSAATGTAPVIKAPSWFNAERFIVAGREHFMSLQQHWDANEMDKIAEFVTPQMLQVLKDERASLGDGYQSTYIDNLQAQLDGVEELEGKTIATITFTGISKESRFDQGEAFSESWRMERLAGNNQPWLLAGIRQNA
ncbi:putative lipid-binding transport protein (Tim44 family) [Pseudomonas duriflava]|uniref:Putative lipid-binding transport protein (Tim44 family) n=1 Tax=Pseudomonas duriflava TaxID=459528 RepID=A0A562QLV3_9PSED|nr:Tim44 domain-containing protein [Pseudomonas duriflava]TWI57704.1 putative lipid-binding transport protein (Tim44 family) [Pseudomonas duriflava]